MCSKEEKVARSSASNTCVVMEITVLASVLTFHLHSKKQWLFLVCVGSWALWSDVDIQLSTYMLLWEAKVKTCKEQMVEAYSCCRCVVLTWLSMCTSRPTDGKCVGIISLKCKHKRQMTVGVGEDALKTHKSLGIIFLLVTVGMSTLASKEVANLGTHRLLSDNNKVSGGNGQYVRGDPG